MNRRAIQTESVLAIFAISVCKTPFRKRNSHRGRKERKEMNEPRIEGSPNPKSVLAIFAISVCKIPVRKDNSHRGRKERKGMDEPRMKGRPNRIGLSDLCDLCV
jgi:hypothetical protein